MQGGEKSSIVSDKKLMETLFQLLVKNPTKRLGCMEKGDEEIKAHSFFKMINWMKVEAREVQPPFKPKIVSSNNLFSIDASFRETIFEIDWPFLIILARSTKIGTNMTKPCQAPSYAFGF